MRRQMSLHGAIRFVMVLVFAVLVYQVTAASLRPPISTRVYGSAVVWPGHDALFRVLCLDADGLTPCTTPHIQAQWSLLAPDGTLSGQGPRVMADTQGVLRLPVPTPLDANAVLSVDVADGARTPVDHIRVAVRAQAEAHPVAGRTRAPLRLLAAGAPEMLATLWPADGSVIAGLVATGAGQLTHKEQGDAAALAGTAGHALVIDGPSDAAGRFRWHAEPQIKRAPWQLQRAGLESLLEAKIEAEPRQLSLRLVEGPFVQTSSNLHVALRTLPFRGSVHIDVWLGQALVAGLDCAQGEHSIPLPPGAHGPLMVTAYRQSLAPDDTHVTQVGWAHQGTEPSAKDVQELAKWLQIANSAERTEADVRWDAAARQGMFVPSVLGAPLLEDTHAARQAGFAEAQTRRRKLGQTSLVTIVSFGGFCAVAYLRHFVLRRRAAIVAVSLDADSATTAHAMTRVDGASWLWPAVGILILMGAGIWQLMGHLITLP